MNSNGTSSINKRAIRWLLVILGMGIIYLLSAQTAAESSGLSGHTIRALLPIFMPEFADLPHLQQNQIVASLQSVVRDAAHVMTYMLLGILCMSALLSHELKMKTRIIIALIICTGYAAIDELHQVFVNGRAFEFIDIGLDFCGALIGAALAAAISLIMKK